MSLQSHQHFGMMGSKMSMEAKTNFTHYAWKYNQTVEKVSLKIYKKHKDPWGKESHVF